MSSKNIQNDDLNDVFSVRAASVVSNSKNESAFYSPSADKGIDKVYSSQIKFITNIHNPSKSFIQKFVVWLQNPDTEEKKSIDCPSTLGKDAKSLLQDAFFALWNSPSAHDKKLSEKFKRKDTYYSLVYIVKDDHNPTLEGKIKIFKFGKQLYDVLESSANDVDEPNDFLDFFNGRTLKLKIVEKSEYNNYASSTFGTKVHYINIDGEDMTDTPKNRKKLQEWLKENSPDISEYTFKPWDEETRKYVIDCIKAIIPNESMVNKILKKGGVAPTVKGKKVELDEDYDTEEENNKKKKSKSNVPKPPIDDEDEDDEPVVKAKPTKKKPVVIEDEDEDEDEDEVFIDPPKKGKLATPKKKPVVVEDDDEDEDDDDEINLDDMDDDELDEIDAHISKINSKPKAKPAPASKKKQIDYDDDDED